MKSAKNLIMAGQEKNSTFCSSLMATIIIQLIAKTSWKL
jgi:hypothetical protein